MAFELSASAEDLIEIFDEFVPMSVTYTVSHSIYQESTS